MSKWSSPVPCHGNTGNYLNAQQQEVGVKLWRTHPIKLNWKDNYGDSIERQRKACDAILEKQKKSQWSGHNGDPS